MKVRNCFLTIALLAIALVAVSGCKKKQNLPTPEGAPPATGAPPTAEISARLERSVGRGPRAVVLAHHQRHFDFD